MSPDVKKTTRFHKKADSTGSRDSAKNSTAAKSDSTAENFLLG